MHKIAVIIPVYGCPEALSELTARLHKALGAMTDDYRVVLVDDACPKNSWGVISSECELSPKVVGIKLSRNFGQHYAILAGMRSIDAEHYVVMDCDLQDAPEIIPSLAQAAAGGFDKVLVRRKQRKHGLIEKVTSVLFYKFLSYMTETEQDASVGNFGIYSNKVVQALTGLGERSRLLPVHSRWIGFSHTFLDIEHNERHSGLSSYSWKKRMALAIDIVLSFSDKPLWLVVKLGFSISAVAFCYALYVLLRWLFGSIAVEGWTSLIISVWLLSGFILATLGFVGVYVAKTFDETKGRPLYIIDKKLNS